MAFDRRPGCCQKLWNNPVMRRPSFLKFLLNRWCDYAAKAKRLRQTLEYRKIDGEEKCGYLYKLQPKRDYFCMDVGYSRKCADRLQPKRNSLCMDVGYSRKCADRLQLKRNSLCMDVGYSRKCADRLQPKRNSLCMDVGYSRKCADRLQLKRNSLCMDVGYSQKCI